MEGKRIKEEIEVDERNGRKGLRRGEGFYCLLKRGKERVVNQIYLGGVIGRVGLQIWFSWVVRFLIGTEEFGIGSL